MIPFSTHRFLLSLLRKPAFFDYARGLFLFLFPVFSIFSNEFENRNFDSEELTIAEEQGAIENPNVVTNKTRITTNTSGCADIKCLILIIASDELPVYLEEQKIWRSYMHSDPDHIRAYFMKCDPSLEDTCVIRGDTIWCKMEECLYPGILFKTLVSMEKILGEDPDIDFIVRTNLSSFYIFPRLLSFLANLPKEKCYCASPIGYASPSPRQDEWLFFGSGAGIILSRDLAHLMVQNQSNLLKIGACDDVVIGDFLYEKKIPLMPCVRYDIAGEPKGISLSIPEIYFHIRCKCHPQARSTVEPYIQYALLQKFYGIEQLQEGFE